MLADSNYRGFGNFSDTWSMAMLIKHAIVFVMIGIGAYLDRVVVPRLAETLAAEQVTGGLKRAVTAMMISGVIVLLLTATAQAL